MVGASRTLDWRAVWDDHAYGLFVPWALHEAAAAWPIEWAPTLLVASSVATWWVAAIWLRSALTRALVGRWTSAVAPFALALLPLPEIAYLGAFVTAAEKLIAFGSLDSSRVSAAAFGAASVPAAASSPFWQAARVAAIATDRSRTRGVVSGWVLRFTVSPARAGMARVGAPMGRPRTVRPSGGGAGVSKVMPPCPFGPVEHVVQW